MNQLRPARAFAAAAAFPFAFLTIAAPYVALIRMTTRHWTVSHEFTAAMMYGMSDVSSDSNAWRRLGFSPAVSPFAALFADPKLCLEKVWGDFVTSLYNFGQALDPILTFFLGVGLRRRGRKLLARDERRLGVSRATLCLAFVKRYPRYGLLRSVRGSTSRLDGPVRGSHAFAS
jgi:hypothetical protein